MFDEAFLSSLPSDPYEAVKKMCHKFNEMNNEHYVDPTGDYVENIMEYYDTYIEAFAALEAFITATGLPFSSRPPLQEQRSIENINSICTFFYNVMGEIDKREHKLTLGRAREKYAGMFGTTFVYQFSDGDIKRIQQLLNELRDTITKSELFDAKHKQRILSKLEGLQSELHKKMSNLDRFWGLIGEAGVVLGKFGQDAKPLVDRIREIAQITWRTQARAEELPSGTTLPLLSDGKQEGS
jgi:hypothetical protein